MNVQWRGIFPAVVSHFSSELHVDESATLRHVTALVNCGVHGVIALGTLGENASLDPNEKRQLVRAVGKEVAGRVPVLAGVAETSTRQACQFAADMKSIGVDGLMVLPALVYPADEREAMAHFRAVACASDLPIMIYNNPVSYVVDLKPESLLQLADEQRFVAVKESSDDIRRITDIRNTCGDRFSLFGGVDDLALEARLLGADGWVAGLVNAFPAETMRLWNLATSGIVAEAVKLYRWFMPLLHLDTHVKLVQYIKLHMQE